MGVRLRDFRVFGKKSLYPTQTRIVHTIASHVIFFDMMSASFAFAIPNLITNATLTPPSATRPRELNGVSKNEWGAA
jgi:hypothetical protein